MRNRLLISVGMMLACVTTCLSQVEDSPITAQVGITGRFYANNSTGTFLLGSFGPGIPGSLYQTAPAAAGWYETGKTWFSLRPNFLYTFTVFTKNIGEFKLHFDPPPGYRVGIIRQPYTEQSYSERMASGDGGFSGHAEEYYSVWIWRPDGAEDHGYLGDAASLRPQRILWSVSMGYLRNGRAAGAIQLRETNVTDAVNSGKLYYHRFTAEVHLVPGTGGTVRQVLAPDGLADVVSVGSNYEIRFYPISQVGSFNGTTYPVSGTPSITYAVEKITNDHMKITKSVGTALVESTELQKLSATRWEVRDWTENNEPCLRKIAYDYPSGTSVEEVTVTAGQMSGTDVATTTRKTYTSIGGYLELESETAGPGTTPAQTTFYSYYDGSGSPGSYRKLKSVTGPDGGWVRYEYFEGPFERQGQLSLKHEPYKDAPASVPTTTEGKITDYSYVADWTGAQRMVSGFATSINGTQTSQTVITYSGLLNPAILIAGRPIVEETRTEYASSSPSNARVTKLKSFRDDAPTDSFQFWPGKLHSIEFPDGTKKAVSYFEGNFNEWDRSFSPVAGGFYVLESVVSGSASSANGTLWTSGAYPVDTVYVVPNQSTLEETVRTRAGDLIYRSTWVFNGLSWARIDGALITYSKRRPLVVTHDSGRVLAEWTYKGTRPITFDDEDDVRFSYSYDQHGRVKSVTKGGITASAPFQTHVAIKTTYGYDADNRLLTTTTGPSTTGETLIESRTFDLAGRPLTSTHHDKGQITFSYPSAREVKMVLPGPIAGGGTREVITETYRDGRFKRRSGNADIPEFHQYWINGNGTEFLQQKPVDTSSHDGSIYTTFDWLGRASQTYFPTFEHETDSGAWNITDFHRSGPDRLNLSVHYTQAASWGGGNVRIAPDRRYGYGKLGELTEDALDTNANGAANADSADRIVRSEARIEKLNGQYWRISRTKVLPSAGQPTERIAEEVRERLTSLASNQISQVETYDSAGRKSTETVTVDRATRVRTSTIYTDGVSSGKTTQWHNGFLFRATSPANVMVTSEYDDLGRLKKVRGRSSVEENFTYVPGKTLVLTMGSAYLPTEQFTYDAAGRVTLRETFNYNTISGPRIGTERFEYNALGQVARQWGSAVQPASFSYNEFGQMTQMTTFDSNNAFATLTTWPGGGGRNTTWTYQPRTGLLQTRTDAAGHTVSFEYNLRGQVRKRSAQRAQTGSNPPQPINVVTEYFYFDGAEGNGSPSHRTGELRKIDYPNSGLGTTESDVTYSYDRMGRIASVEDAAGTRSFAYRDGSDLQLDHELLPAFFASRKIVRSYQTGSTAGRYSGFAFTSNNGGTETVFQNAAYGYSGTNGRLDSITRSSTATNYTFEPGSDFVLQMTTGTTGSWYRKNSWQGWRDLIDSVENRFTGSPSPIAQYISDYDWRMNRDAMTLKGDMAVKHGNAIGVRNRYWNFLSGDVWDREELRQTRTYSVRADNNQDDVELTTPDRYRKWDYSVAGNRTKEVRSGTWQQTYGTNNVDEISSITSTNPAPAFATPVYDYAGNMTTMPGDTGAAWTVTYDAENRPVKFQKATTATRLEMKYDYLGRRIEKAVFPNNTTQDPSTRTRFVYDGWNVIAELDGKSTNPSNAVLRTYTWGLDASHTMDGAGGVGGLIRMEQIEGGATVAYYPIYDSAHNVAGLVKSDGSKTVSYAYGPFGEVTSTWKSDANFTDTNPFRFSTKYTDSETGLVYFGFRYYHPKLGRFINRDPIGEEGGINLHQYVGNNPATHWDFLGLDFTVNVPYYLRDRDGNDVGCFVFSANLSDWDGKSGGLLNPNVSAGQTTHLVANPFSQAAPGQVTFTKSNGETVTYHQRMIETLENSVRSGSGPRDYTPRLKDFGGEVGATNVKGVSRLRETRLQARLESRYGKENVLPERTLRDATGRKVIDPETGTGRRIDFVVLDGRGNVRFSIEATSRSQVGLGGKFSQLLHETRVREAGGIFIRRPGTNELFDISKVPTRVIGLEPIP